MKFCKEIRKTQNLFWKILEMQIVYEISILNKKCIKNFIFKIMFPLSKLFLLELGLTSNDHLRSNWLLFYANIPKKRKKKKYLNIKQVTARLFTFNLV